MEAPAQKSSSEFCGDLFTPSVLLPTFVGQQDSSLERAPKIRICLGRIFLWGLFSGFPKIFFEEKDFWEKEEQALKTWCLPSGKYPKRAP